jgi:hypothetical protein
VLQFAAAQMMKEGLKQVIINSEGTHYIVTELDDCTLQVEEAVFQDTPEEPAEEGEEPAAVGEEPAAVGEEPAAVGEEPAAVEEEPAAVEEQVEEQTAPLLAEQLPGGGMVVFLDGAPHKVILEG